MEGEKVERVNFSLENHFLNDPRGSCVHFCCFFVLSLFFLLFPEGYFYFCDNFYRKRRQEGGVDGCFSEMFWLKRNTETKREKKLRDSCYCESNWTHSRPLPNCPAILVLREQQKRTREGERAKEECTNSSLWERK